MTTITNNKLTDEEITALALKLFDGSSFYFQSGRRPGAKTMAELLNKAASAVAELQERRKADSAEPIGWTDAEELRSVEKDGCGYLFKANPISPNADPRRVIKLYRHAPPAPVVPDERAAFNAWNNEDNLPIAGVGAKNAAWLAWQARASLCGNSALNVPPERPADSSNGDDIEAWFDEGWNACRSAMLNGGKS